MPNIFTKEHLATVGTNILFEKLKDDLFGISKLNNTINTNSLRTDFVNEYISGVHIF